MSDKSERVWCPRHRKVCFATPGKADAIRREMIRSGEADAGLIIFKCWKRRCWHLGHERGWRSLERRIREAS